MLIFKQHIVTRGPMMQLVQCITSEYQMLKGKCRMGEEVSLVSELVETLKNWVQ